MNILTRIAVYILFGGRVYHAAKMHLLRQTRVAASHL